MAGSDLYPLKVSYTYHTKIWGGRTLAKYVDLPEDQIVGEVSLVSDDERGSTIMNGPFKGETLRSVCLSLGKTLIGKTYDPDFPGRFPLILKLIHSQRPLSIQVHPDEDYAREHENASSGKTEAWFILDAEGDATVKIGFLEANDKDEILQAINKGYLENLLGTYNVQPDDTFYLPSGQVHSLGSGVVLAEIQQNTLVTYRLYDYNRIDPATGKKRQLDVDKALQVLDLSPTNDPHTDTILIKESNNTIITFVACRFFCGQKISLKEKLNSFTDGTSFDIVSVFDGAARLNWFYESTENSLNVRKGETIIIPAALGRYSILPLKPNTTLFKYFIPELSRLRSYFLEKGIDEKQIRKLNGFGKKNHFD